MSTDELKNEVTHDEIRENSLRPTMTISPEMFEKLYLAPKADTQGGLRKVFGNPTPIALMGFIVGLGPISIALMGWRGATGGGVATTGDTLFFGGMLLIIAGLLEFVLGNTFPFVVFMGYGSHFLTYATTFMPAYNAVAAFTKDGSQLQTPPFMASFGFYALFLSLISFLFFVCSLRTNVVFVGVFICAFTGFACAAGAFWALAQGNMASGEQLLIATGACFFSAVMCGCYMLTAVMLAVMDMPSPPVGDLSTVIKGVSQRRAMQAEKLQHSE